MRTTSSQAVSFGLIILFGLLSALPSALPINLREKLPSWYQANSLTLGLDLRGGSYLLMAVDADGFMLDQNQLFARALTQRLQDSDIRYARPAISADTIEIILRDTGQLEQVRSLARELMTAQSSGLLAYDSSITDNSLLLEVDSNYRESAVTDALEQSLEVVRRRLDESGLLDPTITRQGQDRIEIQLPGVTDPKRIRELLGTTAQMNFHWLAKPGDRDVITLPGELPGETLLLESDVAMEGRHVRDARMVLSPESGLPVVNFRLDNEGGRTFGKITSANIGRQLAVVLDGKVVTAPVIRTAITGGSGEISGGFSSSEAVDLAVLLRAGALPAELSVLEERTVGPSLGSDAIAMGITTGVMGGLLVLAFMALLYGQWGFIAWIGLCINAGLIFGVLSLLGATLTLPGIAGIILSIGMAVDANILINERIREELRQQRTAWQALDNGFKKAWTTILDSNVTTLIAISFLFLIGSGPVQGFAVTMGIGLLTSMFTAISVTRLLMEWRIRKLGRRPLVMSGIGIVEIISNRYADGGRVIQFMRAGMLGLLVSAILSTASLVLLVKPGMNYGIDFSGGALLEIHSATTTIDHLRDTIEASAYPNIAIQEFGSAADFQLRLPILDANAAGGSEIIDDIRALIQEASPDVEFLRVEAVGPRVSGDFADLSILAVLLAGSGMLLYLWFRYESHFALGAIITIGLDITKTIGFFVVTGIEFNLTAVAALLALIGYSVNDKVVVFDRIRENLLLDPRQNLAAILNKSISTTLTRTVLTSGTTFVALLPMAIAGGSAVSSFALPMLFGIVVGTSSSIFIAAPIVLLLGKRRERKGLPQIKIVSEKELLAERLRP